MNMREISEELAAMSKRVEEIQRLRLPANQVTLVNAFAQLRSAIPARAIKIELEIWSHGSDRELTAKWSVWDEESHYKAQTIQAAVEMCIQGNAKPADAVEEAQTQLDMAAA